MSKDTQNVSVCAADVQSQEPTPKLQIYGLMGTAWAFMQFFCSPIQGGTVRSVRPPSGRLAVQFWVRPRLHCDGARAERRLARRGPGHFRHGLLQFQYRRCLHCRRHATGTASGGVRQDRYGLRARFHLRSRLGWLARRDRPLHNNSGVL